MCGEVAEFARGLSGGIVTDDLYVVAVGVQNERAVIIRMVVRTEARRAVVFAAGGDGRLMKSVHQRTFGDPKCDVDARLVGCSLANPKIGLRWFAESSHIGAAGNGSGKL